MPSSLPMNANFQAIIEQMEPFLESLKSCQPFTWDNLRGLPQKDVYAFYENGEAIYVGRSNGMRQRIRQHGADSSRNGSATFAFKLLLEEIGEPGNHRSSAPRKELEERHSEEYAKQKHRIQNMRVRVVEIEDQRVQTIFETYAILALDTTLYNTFYTT